MGDSTCAIGEKLAQLNQEIIALKEQVSTDPLTGLSNVRHLRFMLEREMERTQRNQQPTTFFILDADHFKRVNDTYGHVVGDKALQHIASLIKTVIRKIDVACRYGGEEFGVILPSTPLLVGTQVAERVRQQLEQNPLYENGQNIPITASIGVDTYLHSHDDSMEEFIARADAELYKAKQSGRNCVSRSSDHLANKAEVTQSEKDALFNLLSDNDEEN
ncbi:MAG: GGDEF domain-containing protein [Agarilytica sp.]